MISWSGRTPVAHRALANRSDDDSGGGDALRTSWTGGLPRLDEVLALHGATRKNPSRHVREADVGIDRAEERNPGADEDRHPGDDHPVDQARAKEALSRHPAVDVDVLEA